MKTVGKIGLSVVGVVVLYIGYKMVKQKLNKIKAKKEGYTCGECDKGQVTCTKTEGKDGAQTVLEFPCGLLPNFKQDK